MAYQGTVSYSLYLVHPYTYYAMRMLFVAMGLFTNHIALSMLLFFLVTTPLTLLVTHVVHHLVELGPYQWFFRQRIYRFRGTIGARSDEQTYELQSLMRISYAVLCLKTTTVPV